MSDPIKIDKGIPVPRSWHGGYPIGQLEVGDSFFAPGRTPNSFCGSKQWQQTKGRKFACRTVTENGVKGTRMWRIK